MFLVLLVPIIINPRIHWLLAKINSNVVTTIVLIRRLALNVNSLSRLRVDKTDFTIWTRAPRPLFDESRPVA